MGIMPIFKKQQSLSLGKRGEEAALNYLKKQNYKILATNFFNPVGRRLGEIDIVAKDGRDWVFVEVKTRKNNSGKFILPEESINRLKLRKLNKIAGFYLSKNKLVNAPYRFDAITVLADPEKNQASLRHIKNIFL